MMTFNFGFCCLSASRGLHCRREIGIVEDDAAAGVDVREREVDVRQLFGVDHRRHRPACDVGDDPKIRRCGLGRGDGTHSEAREDEPLHGGQLSRLLRGNCGMSSFTRSQGIRCSVQISLAGGNRSGWSSDAVVRSMAAGRPVC